MVTRFKFLKMLINIRSCTLPLTPCKTLKFKSHSHDVQFDCAPSEVNHLEAPQSLMSTDVGPPIHVIKRKQQYK